ncbi:DUF6191 domain-containing protein [Kitasatospora sp. NPDC059577]|uniref:DUF6191 domain-containing protein n=1 Tax=unclassified Kitasatospora TaxID=2633591 RepID=UPI0036C57F0C
MLELGIALAAILVLAPLGVGIIRWLNRKRRETSGYASNFEFMDVFHPAQQHVRDESQRQQLPKEDEGSGAPPIDLKSGRAVISRPTENDRENEKPGD